MKNKIEDLRNHLFEIIENLKDDDATIDLEKAKMVNEIAQTIVNSAKVEVDFLRATGRENGTGFLQIAEAK